MKRILLALVAGLVLSISAPINGRSAAQASSDRIEAQRRLARAFELEFAGSDLEDIENQIGTAIGAAPDWWVPFWAMTEIYIRREEYGLAAGQASAVLQMGGDAEPRGRIYYLTATAQAKFSNRESLLATAEAAQEYIDRQPASSSGYHFLGYAQLHLSQTEDAIETLRHGLRFDPWHLSMILNLADALGRLEAGGEPVSDGAVWNALSMVIQEPAAAAAHFDEAFAAAEGSDELMAHVYLALALFRFGQGDYPGTIEAATEATTFHPMRALAYQTIARAYTGMEIYNTSLPYFDRALELNPALIDLHRFRVRAYGFTQDTLPVNQVASFFTLTSRHTIPWELDPDGTTILPYLDLGAYEMTFEAAEGQRVHIVARAAFGTDANPVIMVARRNGSRLASAHSIAGRRVAELTLIVPATGSYTLMVGDVHPRTAVRVQFEVSD